MRPIDILRKPFRYSFANASLYIILANVLVFVLIAFAGEGSVIGLLGLSVSGVFGSGRFWQVFTYMFCHGGVTHIIFNMIGLYMFGTQIERRVGTREFLLFYLLNGLLVGCFILLLNRFVGPSLASPAREYAYYVPTIGASGAIFALLLAFAAFYPESKVLLFGFLPVRAPVMVIGYTLMELALQIFFRGGDGISHLSHLAGFGFAYLYFLLRYGINPWKRFFLG